MAYKYKNIKLSPSVTRGEHRVLMESFLGRPLLRTEVVHHKNGDGRDNRLANLELMPLSDHSSLHQKGHPPIPLSEAGLERLKLRFTGEGHPQAKLNAALVRTIRASPLGPRELGRQLKLSHVIISQVKTRKRWRHVLDD